MRVPQVVAATTGPPREANVRGEADYARRGVWRSRKGREGRRRKAKAGVNIGDGE